MKFLCQWKDGSEDWVPLKDLKDSYPIQVAEYAVAVGITNEPALAWWVKDTLFTRNRYIPGEHSSRGLWTRWATNLELALAWWLKDILFTRNRYIDKIKSRYWKVTHKFGYYWRDAIKKEMKRVSVAYHPYHHEKDGEVSVKTVKGNRNKYLIGYKQITCHLVFDIKLDGSFTRKARFVANGSRTEAPKSLTYSSVVSRDSIRIAFLI